MSIVFRGGTFYSRYDFDVPLLREYKEMLGDGFLGLQMHEWGAVLVYDWRRIRKQLAGVPAPWTEQQIHDAVQKVSACKWCIHLSSGTAREFSEKRYAETVTVYVDEMKALFALRQGENEGLLLPCDSNVMATGLEYRLGARMAMAEVGAQTPLARLQVAITRGASMAAGRPWGLYYEPWGGEPFSTCHFLDEKVNEWRLDNAFFPFDVSSQGANGGSSRSLQRRLFHYALLSGAHYLGEEWGLNNTFYNWRDYALTPYGEIKKAFISFAETYRDLVPHVPIAIVIPRECEVIDLNYIHRAAGNHYLGRELDARQSAIWGHVRKVLRLVYGHGGRDFGNEGHVLTNSAFGDLFDVVGEDAGEQALRRYEVLVDATADGCIKRSKGDKDKRFLESGDLGVLEQSLHRVIATACPCTVSCGVHWLLNRHRDRWVLSLFNNEGVERSGSQGDSFHPEAGVSAVIRFRQAPRWLERIAGYPGECVIHRIDALTYTCALSAGGFASLEYGVA